MNLPSCNGVDGNVDGSNVSTLVHTQFEANPYWEVDLGSQLRIVNIRLWNRADEANDMSMAADVFTKRLFPCWIIISQFPFPSNTEGKESLDSCLKNSVASIRMHINKRLSIWSVPKFVTGRYVRIQLEEANFLHFAQVEVFGHEGRNREPVTSCTAGKFVTAAVVGGIRDLKGIETAYMRAICADWYVVCHPIFVIEFCFKGTKFNSYHVHT